MIAAIPIPGPGLLFGLMLVAAIAGGYVARLSRIPKVVGYLLSGVALRVAVTAVFHTQSDNEAAHAIEMAGEPLAAIKNLALGMILFTIGGVFERSRLRAAAQAVTRIAVVEIAAVFVAVLAGCAGVALLTQWRFGAVDNLVLAALLAASAIATAPAATLFVLQEYDAKGPITETVLGLTGVNNVVCIVLFHALFLILAAVQMISTTGIVGQHLGLALTFTTVGSIVLGMVLGTGLSIIHAKLPISETILFFFAIFILLGAGESWLFAHRGLSYNFLLTALVIGAVFANVAIDSRKLESLLRTVGTPIFVGFFALAGYDLHLAELSRLGWVGGAYIVCRLAGKGIGGWIGVRWAKAPARVGNSLGGSLLCQAAVVIGLASYVTRNWHSELAHQFSTVILGSVVVFELLGPLLIKRCVVNGGEVKAITLLRRSSDAEESVSILKLMLQSLGRFVGIGRFRIDASPGEMQVEHIMRTNVQYLHSSDTLDEVLHFMERSTYAHFPVVNKDNTIVGVIHFSDVRDVIYDPVLRDLVTAVDLADEESAVVPMDMTWEELLEVFERQNVSMLPVADLDADKRIVGVVEQRDLLRALHVRRRRNKKRPGKNGLTPP